MVQLSNHSNHITSIINPNILGANREANLLCPKIVMEDIELTLTLKILETKLYNLCLEQNSFKLLIDDLSIGELMGRKERTARSYISKLTKLGKVKKLPCKEKAKYYLVFSYGEWMQLSKNEIMSIDEGFNLIASNLSLSSEGAEDCKRATNLINLTNPSESSATFRSVEPEPQGLENRDEGDSEIERDFPSSIYEVEEIFCELTDEEHEKFIDLLVLIEDTWQQTGELSELKRTWKELNIQEVWDNYLSEVLDEKARRESAKELLLLKDKTNQLAKLHSIENAIAAWTIKESSSSAKASDKNNTSTKVLANNCQNAQEGYELRLTIAQSPQASQTPQVNKIHQIGKEKTLATICQSEDLAIVCQNDQDNENAHEIIELKEKLANVCQEFFEGEAKSELKRKGDFTSVGSLILNGNLGKEILSSYQANQVNQQANEDKINQSINTNNVNKLADCGKNLPQRSINSNDTRENDNRITSSTNSHTATDNNFGSSSSNNNSSSSNTTTTSTAYSPIPNPNPNPVPTTTTDSFKALKAFKAYSSLKDLNNKEEEKSFKSLREENFGTNMGRNSTGEEASTTSTSSTPNTATTQNYIASNQKSDEDEDSWLVMERFKEQQETAEGVIYNRLETIILADYQCKYCLGKSRVFKQITEQKSKELVCICCQIYMLEPLANEKKRVLVGTPKLTAKELLARQEVISQMDEEKRISQLKVLHMPCIASMSDKTESLQNTQNESQPKAKIKLLQTSQAGLEGQAQQDQVIKQPQWQLQGQGQSYGVGEEDKSNNFSNIENTEVQQTEGLKNTIVNLVEERMAVSKEEFPYIEQLNQTANSRLNAKGKADLKILSSKCGNYWILPNQFNQERKSSISFWDWLLYALRQPNRNQPVRLACSRYYLGNKDEEIKKWLKQRASLGVGGSLQEKVS